MGWHWGILAASGAGAAAAYEHIQSTILTGSQASVTFSNLNTYASTYKHLQLRMVVGTDPSDSLLMVINGDTGNNYAHHSLIGYPALQSTPYANASTSTGTFRVGISSANFSPNIIDILDFSSTSKNTTTRTMSGNVNTQIIRMFSGLWNNTAAVTSIEIKSENYLMQIGSRFSLYGIKG